LSAIRREWNRFYEQHPSATKEELLAKATEIDEKFGHLFAPPLGATLMFYKLDPEVAGHFGPGTTVDTSTHPPIVHSLHYIFDGWLGDELLTAFPCFIVTKRMQQLIESANPSGCTFEGVLVSKSELFEELHAERRLPQFSRLLIDGLPHRDDIGTTATGGSIIVSDRLFQAMKRGRLDHCEITAV